MSIKDVILYMAGRSPDGDDHEPMEPVRYEAVLRADPDHEPTRIVPPPPKPRTTVGAFVVALADTLAVYRNQALVLDAEIAAKIEHRRQLAATIAGTESALVTVSIDPALTEDERAMANQPLETRLERELG